MKKLFVSLLVLLSTAHALAGETVAIRLDKQDCREGRMSMDVEIRVGSESFRFSPSCRFSFRESFETKRGTKCEVKAGMCSAFSPRHKIEVECKGSFRETEEILCADEK